MNAGEETFGRVKVVAGTPIVTKFVMLHFLPIVPQQSYYLIREQAAAASLPGLLTVTEIVGYPLARCDLTSIVVTYARALFGALFAMGFLFVAINGVTSLTNPRPQDADLVKMFYTACIALGVGVIGGGLTYVIPLMSRRERDIRGFCAELLGVGADPARVRPDVATELAEFAESTRTDETGVRDRLIVELVGTRASLAQQSDRIRAEQRTDELLKQLRDGEHAQ